MSLSSEPLASSIDVTVADGADGGADAWEDAAPPPVERAHPVLESLRDALLINATPDVRYALERVNINRTDRGAGRAMYHAIADYTLRTLLPAALYRPSDWRWPRTRIVDDATLLSAAEQYTDDAFSLDRAPSFDMRCVSDECPAEAERRANCNTRPLDFVRGWLDATVLELRRQRAAMDAGVADGAPGDGAAVDDGGSSVADRSDEEYCSDAMTLITELSMLTEVRGDCRSAQSSSVPMLQAIATVARRRLRPAGTPVPLRDASSASDR